MKWKLLIFWPPKWNKAIAMDKVIAFNGLNGFLNIEICLIPFKIQIAERIDFCLIQLFG